MKRILFNIKLILFCLLTHPIAIYTNKIVNSATTMYAFINEYTKPQHRNLILDIKIADRRITLTSFEAITIAVATILFILHIFNFIVTKPIKNHG